MLLSNKTILNNNIVSTSDGSFHWSISEISSALLAFFSFIRKVVSRNGAIFLHLYLEGIDNDIVLVYGVATGHTFCNKFSTRHHVGFVSLHSILYSFLLSTTCFSPVFLSLAFLSHSSLSSFLFLSPRQSSLETVSSLRVFFAHSFFHSMYSCTSRRVGSLSSI